MSLSYAIQKPVRGSLYESENAELRAPLYSLIGCILFTRNGRVWPRRRPAAVARTGAWRARARERNNANAVPKKKH
jgi:hypothetical protein